MSKMSRMNDKGKESQSKSTAAAGENCRDDCQKEKAKGGASTLAAEVYKNTKMGADSIIDLLGHAKDERLKLEMTSELNRYEALAARAAKLSRERGEEPREEGALTKAAVKMSMAVNTMTDSSDPHIAEMMIQGANMGVTDLRRSISAEEAGACPDREAVTLARETVSFEEDSAERLKAFL